MMLYSKSEKEKGGTGFFFENTPNIPADAIKVSNEDALAAINRPAGADYDFTAGGVLIITPGVPLTAAQIRADAIAKVSADITAERDRRQLSGGVKVGAHWFLSNERATTEYNTIINTTRGIPDSTVVRADWRTMDGALVDMTPALALQILTAGISQRCAIDDAAQAHKAALAATADPESYDFSPGWPAIFEG